MKYPFKKNTLSNRMKLFSRICIFVGALLAVVPFVSQAATALDSVPDAVKSKYAFDGPVYAVVSDGATLYVGGSFTAVTPRQIDPPSFLRNNLAAIDLSTYTLTSFAPSVGGGVDALALSADGETLYVGGSFSCVGALDEFDVCTGVTQNKIAAFDTAGSGTLLPFNPDISGGDVATLTLSSGATPTLYVGGDFSQVGATTRNTMAAFDMTDNVGTLLSFNPDISTDVNDSVLSQDESTIYVTGTFSTVNGGMPQEYLAALDAVSGENQDWGVSLDGGGNVLKISSDGNTLYVGGSFSSFMRQSGEGVPFDEDTNEALATFPIVRTNQGGGGGGDSTIYAVIPDGDGGWYIGGSFTHVGTTSQGRLAHITSGGLFDDTFTPDVNGTVYALELSPDGSTLYIGGNFDTVDGESRDYFAALDTSDGSVTVLNLFFDGIVRDLKFSSDGSELYVAGGFSEVAASSRRGVAALDMLDEGSLLPFDADLYGSGYAYALELSPDDSVLYVGGDFSAVKYGAGPGTLRNNSAAFTTADDGAVTAFNPNADGILRTLALSGGGDTLYAGGEFLTIGGEARHEFAELDMTTGSSTGLLDANIVGEVGTVQSIAVSGDGASVYIGGANFSEIGGASRAYFGEIDANTGLATNFNPSFNDEVRAIAVDSVGGTVYVGGSFTKHDPESSPYLLAINLADNSHVTSFAPILDADVYALALSSDDTVLYAAGYAVDGDGAIVPAFLKGIDTSDGDATAFAPDDMKSIYAMALRSDDSELFVPNFDQNVTNNTNVLVFDADGDVSLDVTAPVITLLGSSDIELTVGSTYTDAGATAEDNVDGDITADIEVGGDVVNPSVVGIYVITYNVQDSEGNSATEVTRTVTIVSQEEGSGGSLTGRSGAVGSGSGKDLRFLLEKLTEVLRQYLMLLLAEKQQ
ncbi:DUF5011 domain-containing protein [Candidatus Campbellbacteria bacterium]|nr:MAG: DUF5011 domain-containing protein [Candidatus Campbellbacteria bacterium]